MVILVEDGRIELPLHACKAHVLPLSLIPQILGSPGRARTSDIEINSFALLPTELLGNNLIQSLVLNILRPVCWSLTVTVRTKYSYACVLAVPVSLVT